MRYDIGYDKNKITNMKYAHIIVIFLSKSTILGSLKMLQVYAVISRTCGDVHQTVFCERQSPMKKS